MCTRKRIHMKISAARQARHGAAHLQHFQGQHAAGKAPALDHSCSIARDAVGAGSWLLDSQSSSLSAGRKGHNSLTCSTSKASTLPARPQRWMTAAAQGAREVGPVARACCTLGDAARQCSRRSAEPPSVLPPCSPCPADSSLTRQTRSCVKVFVSALCTLLDSAAGAAQSPPAYCRPALLALHVQGAVVDVGLQLHKAGQPCTMHAG